MKFVARFVGLVLTLVALVGCGGAGSSLSGPQETERGEAHAINPARNVTVTCENKNTNSSVTVNITNNCNKNNATAEPFVAESGE